VGPPFVVFLRLFSKKQPFSNYPKIGTNFIIECFGLRLFSILARFVIPPDVEN